MPCPFSHGLNTERTPSRPAGARAAPERGAGTGHDEPDARPHAHPHARPGAPPRIRPLHRIASRLDGIDVFALVLLFLGAGVFLAGTWVEPPSTFRAGLILHYADWAPGLLTDGMLLLVVNSILKSHERRRVLSQVGSLSREFALDAVRRARSEGWLTDGSMRGQALCKAALAGVDLSDAMLREADLSFATLGGAVLTYTDLRGTDLTGSDLRDADLRWADLSAADLSWADLRGALLDGARLDGIVARGASVDPRHAALPELTGSVAGGYLDDAQVQEVTRTFALLARQGSAPVERFYARLFAELPEVRGMFRSEPELQARKFMQSLKVIVASLHAPQRHVSTLQRLGARHRGYGVMDAHYDVVGRTLLSVLEEALGPEFTPEARAAWTRAFTLMATIMMARPDTGAAAAPPTRPG